MSKTKQSGILAPATFKDFKAMRAEMGLVKLAEFSGISQTTLHRVKQAQTTSDLKLMASSIEKITMAVQRHNSGEGETTIQPIRGCSIAEDDQGCTGVQKKAEEDQKKAEEDQIQKLREFLCLIFVGHDVTAAYDDFAGCRRCHKTWDLRRGRW